MPTKQRSRGRKSRPTQDSDRGETISMYRGRLRQRREARTEEISALVFRGAAGAGRRGSARAIQLLKATRSRCPCFDAAPSYLRQALSSVTSDKSQYNGPRMKK